MTKGVPFQILSMTTAHRAVSRFPSQEIPSARMPSFFSTALMMPTLASYRKRKVSAAMTDGTAHGIRAVVRKKPRPLIFRFSARAISTASTTCTMTLVSVQNSVF